MGPEDRHAALVMGNSVEAWQKFYDKFAHERDAKEGLQMMKEWRMHMLESETAIMPHLDQVMCDIANDGVPHEVSDESDEEWSP